MTVKVDISVPADEGIEATVIIQEYDESGVTVEHHHTVRPGFAGTFLASETAQVTVRQVPIQTGEQLALSAPSN